MQNLSFRQEGYLANQPRICDICQIATCTIYCQNESAYHCHGCDEFIHSSNAAASLHERLLICNACEIASATFACQSYGASFCVNCDIDLHLANPLACCNNRASEPPFPDSVLTSSITYLGDPQPPMLDMQYYQIISDRLDYEELNNETDSWLVFDLGNNEQEIEHANLLEKYSYTEYQDQGQDNQHQISSFDEGKIGNVTLFPAQFFETDEHQQPEKLQQEGWRQQQHLQEQPPPQQQQNDHVNEYEATKAASIGTANSQKDQVSMCCLDSGDLTSATTREISVRSLSRTPQKAADPSPKPLQLVPFPFSSTNREAKLLRHREKRKARKFDKKIRYASRKANAETRPRLKGQFVRKTAVLCEMDQMSIAEEYMHAALVPLSS